MSTPLRLLGITGSDTGLNGLVKRLIQKGYEPLVTRVDTIEAMQDELSARSWDIVIIDARFTHIDIFLALAVLREHLEDIPCLVISDPVGDERAVAIIKAGATDFLLAAHMKRIAQRIKQALRESHLHRQHQQTEYELATLNHGLRLLASVTEALLMASTEEQALHDVCHIAVDVGQFQQAWIGVAIPNYPLGIHIAAHAGDNNAPGAKEQIFRDLATNAKHYPITMAIRTGEPAYFDDITFLPDELQWRNEALQRGIRSVIALPIAFTHRMGALTLYGNAPHHFESSEIQLLMEMAGNIGCRIRTLQANPCQTSGEAGFYESAETFRAIFDNTAVGIMLLDIQGFVLEVNTAAQQLFGYTSVELAQFTIGDLTYPEDIESELASLQEILAGQRNCHQFEKRYIRKTGEVIWGRLTISLLHHDLSHKAIAIGVIENITEQRKAQEQLRESEERYRALFNSMSEGFALHEVICSENGEPVDYRFLDVNPAFERLTGIPYDRVVGNTIRTLLPDIEQEWITTLGQVALSGHPMVIERHMDPLKRYFHVVAYSPRYRQFASVFCDVTDRVMAEMALERERALLSTAIDILPFPIAFISPTQSVIRANHVFDRFIAKQKPSSIIPLFEIQLLDARSHQPLAVADWPQSRALGGEVIPSREYIIVTPDGDEIPIFAEAAPIYVNERLVAAVLAYQDITELKSVDEAKNRFLMVLSHELKTPLTSIIGWAQIARDNIDDAPEALQIILDKADEQKVLLERLLLLSRILTRRLQVQYQSVDFWHECETALSKYQRAIAKKQITISLDSPPVSLPVFTDPSLLSHAFDEIIDNAIKFSIPGGCITVKGFRSDGWCMIRISDTGRGISAENIPELLKPFIQLHRDEKVGGLGIGIPIANGILFQLDGALSITSPGLGRGSTCTLTLPAHNHV